MTHYTEEQLINRRKAANRYAAKTDRINCNLPKGTIDRIKGVSNASVNKFIRECVLSELDRMERMENMHK